MINHSKNSAPKCPGGILSRRDFLKYGAGASLLLPSAIAQTASGGGAEVFRRPAPRAPTAIGICKRYALPEVQKSMSNLFDQLGDIGRLVKGKHVTVKTNLVNSAQADVSGVPLWLTVTVHPTVALVLGKLLVERGAKTVVFCDQLPVRKDDAAAFAEYGFHLDEFNGAMDNRARFVNTRNRGRFRDYATVPVPGGGVLANAWEVNRIYAETDVLISLAKLKSHVSGGITAGMKNLFGVPPSSLYGDDLEEEPDESAVGYRSSTMHECTRRPLTSVDAFTGRSIEGDHGYNVPRFIVDLNAAFPIDLVVIDAISTIQTAEGWWLGSMVSVTRPGLLLAGRNAVCADAVAAAVMGFDSDATDRTWPFVNGTNYLALARKRGLGENRISELEVSGVRLAEARFHYQPTYRRTAP